MNMLQSLAYEDLNSIDINTYLPIFKLHVTLTSLDLSNLTIITICRQVHYYALVGR